MEPYLILNDQTVSLKESSPHLTLLHYLRQQGYVGTKEGCGDGDCGACTVAMVSRHEGGKLEYQAINSCLVPLGAVAGREIITVEGIGGERLHPVQEAMVTLGGSQCGYCTPGFIMSLFCGYYGGRLSDRTVEGNLCRCTGYLPIRLCIAQLRRQSPDDRFTAKLDQVPATVEGVEYEVKGDRFCRPTHLPHLFHLLHHYPEATLIAGGTDLGLHLSHHTRTFPVLISLEAIPELHHLHITPTTVHLGAALPLTHLQNQLQSIFPSLDTMLQRFAAPQIRHRATLGGNLATASPIGDLAPVLLSLNATIHLAHSQGERQLPLAQFFRGYRQTDLQPGEIILSVSIPRTLPPQAVHRFSQSYKIGKRGTDDISIVAAAFTLDLDQHYQIIQAKLAYGGVAPTPQQAIVVEQFLEGKPWNVETLQAAKSLLHHTFTPITDLRASATYRQHLVANLFEKFFYDFPPLLQS